MPDLLDFVSAKEGRAGSGVKRRLTRYFVIRDADDGAFLRHTTVVAQAQAGLSPQLILNADFLPAATGIPVFSSRFVDETRSWLEQDLEFHRCVVRCGEQEYDSFHVARTKTYLPLVDEARSEHRTGADGRPILTRAAFHEELADRFLIARDVTHQERLVCSPRLVELVQSKGLRVNFTAAR